VGVRQLTSLAIDSTERQNFNPPAMTGSRAMALGRTASRLSWLLRTIVVENCCIFLRSMFSRALRGIALGRRRASLF
jgi:hypothetical protein